MSRLLAQPDIRALRDPDAGFILVETFIPGREYAVEGVLSHGRLQVLAIFDKPDPLYGPYFEETLYVTPSRASEQVQRAMESAVDAACRALGLTHGPIHAECRVNDHGVFILEVAARPIGGICARALRFKGPKGATGDARGAPAAPCDRRARRSLGAGDRRQRRDDDPDPRPRASCAGWTAPIAHAPCRASTMWC